MPRKQFPNKRVKKDLKDTAGDGLEKKERALEATPTATPKANPKFQWDECDALLAHKCEKVYRNWLKTRQLSSSLPDMDSTGKSMSGMMVNCRDFAAAKSVDPYTLFVGNLPEHVTLEKMTSMFENANAIKIDFGVFRKNGTRRYAFIKFRNVQDAVKAYKCNANIDQVFQDKNIVIRFRHFRNRSKASTSRNRANQAIPDEDIPDQAEAAEPEAADAPVGGDLSTALDDNQVLFNHGLKPEDVLAMDELPGIEYDEYLTNEEPSSYFEYSTDGYSHEEYYDDSDL